MGLRQGKDALASYTSKFRQALMHLRHAQPQGLPEETVIMRYKQELRPEFQEEFERDEPNTLIEAVRVAERAEMIWKRKHQTTKPEGESLAMAMSDDRSAEKSSHPDTPPTVSAIRRLEATQGRILQALERGVIVRSH